MRLAAACIAFAACLLAAAGAAAQEAGVFQLFVNLQPRGDVFVRQEGVGDYWIKVADLKAAGLADAKGEARVFNGETYLRLSSVKGVLLDVDDAELTISITAKPEAFGTQDFSLATSPLLKITPSTASSAFLNYRAGYEQTAGQTGARTFDNQLNVWSRGWLFQYADSYDSSLPDHNYVRQSTNLIYDWPERMQRLNIGDITALSGELGTLRNLGGIGFSRVFDTQPGFVSNPTARFIGTATFPSTAEVYVDGVRVSSQRINPGTFQFNNLDYYGGLRNTEIVIRDPYGGRQVLTRSVYFTDQLLKQGLQDYSYNIGVERENVGIRSNDYSGGGYSIYHRYGWSDSLTIGARSDGNSEAYSIGPLAAVTLGGYGLFGGAVSARRNKELEETSYARLVRYTFDSRFWTGRAQWKKTDQAYSRTVSDPAPAGAPRLDTLVGVGYNNNRGFGSVSFDVSRSDAWDGTYRHAKTLAYSVTVRNSIQLFASVARVNQDNGEGWEGFGGVSINFEGRRTVSATRQRTLGVGNTDVVEATQSAPDGEGYGYRLAWTNTEGESQAEPFGQWNARHVILTADGTYRTSGDPTLSTDRTGVAASGAMVFAGGHMAFTRPVQSSFAAVKVGEVEDVRVYRNHQEVGRTDSNGLLVVPNITAYTYNSISIGAEDVPMAYELSELERTIVPQFGAGVMVDFGLRRIRAYEGMLSARIGQREQAIEHVTVTLRKDGKEQSIVTGYKGEFYLDGFAPGEYEGSFILSGAACRFTLSLPDSKNALTQLVPTLASCAR